MSTKPKATPGPWAIDRMGANGTDIVGSGIHICQVSALQQKTENSNAALIAAAPELYTIAEWLNGFFIEGGGEIRPGQPMEKIVQQVLAKARGES